MTRLTEPGEPGSSPDPEVPAASVTLADVQADPELSLFISSADRVMEGMGFTEHGFRHANLVASISYQVLHRLGYTEREADLACVAGYLHDVGNMLTREAHAQTGAILVYQALKDRAAGNDLAAIMAAVANHEEDQGYAVSPISAAVILADKSDVHRSRVRRSGQIEYRHPRPRQFCGRTIVPTGRLGSPDRHPRADDRHGDESGHGVLRDLPRQDADVSSRR